MSLPEKNNQPNEGEIPIPLGLMNFIFKMHDQVQRDLATLSPEDHPDVADQTFITPDKAYQVDYKAVLNKEQEVDIEVRVTPMLFGMVPGPTAVVDLSDYGRRGDPSIEVKASLTWSHGCHSCGSRSRVVLINVGWLQVRICSYCLVRILPKLLLDAQEMAPEPCHIEDTRDTFDVINGTSSDLLRMAAILVEGAVGTIVQEDLPISTRRHIEGAAGGGYGSYQEFLDRHDQRKKQSEIFGGNNAREK